MADDRDPSQQTEQPTAKRLEEAREHGDVVKSPEVSTFVLLLGGTMAIMMFGGSVMKSLTLAMRIFIEQPDQMGVSGSDLAALAALAAIAAADYVMQRYRFLQRNKMSKQEIKEEYKQNEGDPQIKAKIRQIRIERSKKRMIAAVPEATVIITNPTHYAIALK